jgi:hypothetical protein
LLLLSFPLGYFIVAGSVRNLFFRYAIPLVPFLCLTAARCVTRLVRNETWALAVGVVLVVPSAISVIQFDRIVNAQDNRVIVARWFDPHVPAGNSVLMSGSPYGYVQFTRDRYKAWVWDRGRQIFITDLDRRVAAGEPDWILVQESPLPYETQDLVKDLLKRDYQFVERFPAFEPGTDRVYDQQDAFFVPFAGFRGVRRPGPNFTLYKRSGSAP